MILGLGCDIVQVSRFLSDERFLLRFIKKYLTDKEIDELNKSNKLQNIDEFRLSIATRFAAKEAVSKALGTGFQNGITLKDIEILHDTKGCPFVNLYNKALMQAIHLSDKKNYKMHITLSNEREYVNAVAVLEII